MRFIVVGGVDSVGRSANHVVKSSGLIGGPNGRDSPKAYRTIENVWDVGRQVYVDYWGQPSGSKYSRVPM